ncbi:hypothetical protein DAI22_12g196800 [Oryza sativa Japonica Group]|nr:hypothetical protein DAI22_12g196800 [Oryza sativa Japonica Group]
MLLHEVRSGHSSHAHTMVIHTIMQKPGCHPMHGCCFLGLGGISHFTVWTPVNYLYVHANLFCLLVLTRLSSSELPICSNFSVF